MGFIGIQVLQVIEEYFELYEVYVLIVNNKVDFLIVQVCKFMFEVVVIVNEEKYV